MSKKISILTLTFLLFFAGTVLGQNSYKLITSTADLVAGQKYLIGSAQSGSTQLLGYQNTNNRPQASGGAYTITSSAVSITPASSSGDATKPYELTLGGSSGAWTFTDAVTGINLQATSSSSNYLKSGSGTWTISFSSNAAVITCTNGGTNNIVRYNSSATLFSCYASGQAAVYLYRRTYPVIYNGNGSTGGTVPTDASSPYFSGATVTVKANTGTLVRTGYTFSGWNTKADGSGTDYAATGLVTYTKTAANDTLFAKWVPAGYTVTFDANGGTGTMANQTASTATNLTSNAFTRAGFVFTGWNTAANGSGTPYANGASYPFTANATLYAQWAATYTVTYNGNSNTGGSAPTDGSSPYTAGSTVTVSANTGSLTRTGYTFAGWNTASNGSGTDYAATGSVTFSMPASNTVLYAKWTPNNNTITFDGNGFTSGSTSSQILATAATANLNTNGYLRTGYTFAGWNTAADGSGTSYADGASYTMGTANVTLYAQWLAAGSYTVTFDGNGSTGGSMSPQTTNTATALITNTFTRTGYTFSGWNTVAGGGGTAYADGASYPFTANVTLYAQWTINSYTVTFNGNSPTSGSPSIASVSGNYNTNVTLATAGTLVKTGYTFAGWNTAADGSGTTYAAGLTTYTVTSNVTLYAKWNINSYTVTFDGNSSTSGSPSVASVSGNYNTNVTLATAGTLVKTGYTFAGWNTAADGSGTTYAAGATYTVTANITLYAIWNINNYTVTFSGNSPTSGSPSIASVSGNYNTNVTLATAGTLVKTGYTFGGWNTAADGSGTTYAAGLTTYTITANITLYAKWNINSYTVTFDGNSPTSGSPSVASVSGNYNTNVTLATSGTLIKTGFTFSGWNTAADGSGTTYAAGATYTVTANITLYAIWNVGPCHTEDFSGIGSSGSYSTKTWSGTGGTWSATDAREDQTLNGKAITIRNGAVTSPTFTDGIASITLSTRFPFSETGSTKNLTVEVNGTLVGTVLQTDMTGSTPITKTFSGINIAGNVVITLTSASGARYCIDDVNWTCYTACTPPATSATGLSFSNPTSGSLDLNFTRGDGDSVLIVAKAGSAATNPTANTSYNLGDAVGGGTVVYKGVGSGTNTSTTISIGSLTAETLYYFTVYEYKASTQCYQEIPLSGSRYTLSTEPNTQPSGGFSSTTCTTSSIDLTFPPASGISNADGYIIIMNAGSAPTGVPTDGQAYVLNDGIGGDTVKAIINSTSATTTTVSGLNPGVIYYFSLIPYNANGTPVAQTYNYKTNGIILGTNFTTLTSGTSTTSSVTTDAGYGYTQNIAYANYQSSPVPNSAAQSVGVHEITIKDGGASADADILPTLLSGITFTYTGTANTIRSAALFTNTNSKIREASAVGSNTITFSSLPDTITLRAADNDSTKLILRVTFGTTVTDNEKLVFTVSSVSGGNICSYSQFTTPSAVSDNAANDKNRIEVTATCQKFVQQPTNTSNASTMSPSVTVAAIDNNKNQDLDWAVSSDVACSTPSALSGNPVSGSISGGLTTIGSLVHTIDGTYTLTASASGLRDTVSSSYVISSLATGTYRTTGAGTWPSGSATWERFNGSGWSSATPAANATDLLIIRHAVTSRASFAAPSPDYTSMIIENGGSFNDAHNSTFSLLQVKTGGKFIASDPAVDVSSTGSLTVDSGGVLVINSGTLNHVDGLFGGTENFKKGSTLEIQNWDYDSSPGEDDLIDSYSSTQISTNAAGYYFGNLYINPNTGFTSKAFVLVGVTGTHKLCQDSLIINNNSASTKSVLLTNVNANVEIGGTVLVKGYGFAFGSLSSADVTHTVNGNLVINSNTAVADINELRSSSGTVVVNLKGDLIGTAGTFKCTDDLDAPLSSLHFTNTVDTQNIDIVVGSDTLRKFNMFIDSASNVKLRNNNLELDNTSSLTVKSRGSFNFSWNSSGTPLIVTQPSSPTGTNTFTTQRRSTLKITSPGGIVKATATYGAAVGNVQNISMSNRDYNQVATYWYIGRTSQKTGDGINQTGAGTSFGKQVICELSSNNDTLTPSVTFALSNDVEVSPTGGKLDIRKGKFIETETEYITGTNGTLYMSPGTLYKVLKGYNALTTESGTGGTYIPRMEGTSAYPYILTGGTIELAGSGSHAFQTLRADDANYNYVNVKFSGANTLGTNFKNLSSQTTIDSALIITGTAIVDCKTTGAGIAASFIGNGGLVMDGGRIRIKNTSNIQPELVGDNVAYNLTGGTVELYGTSATQQQLMRGNYTSASSNPPFVNYYNIDINADAANWSTGNTFGDAGNVNMSSSFKLTGTLNVNAPAVFRMDETDNISNGTGTSQVVNINDYAGLLYGSPNGIKSSGTGTSDGNIRTSGTRNFSSKASYGFIGNGDMVTGNGLPATTNGLYVYKYGGSNKVTLSNTVRADSILKMSSGHIITGTSNFIELGKDISNLGTLSYTTGYVVGKMRRWYNGTNSGIASGLFPLGEDVSGTLRNRKYLIEFTSAPTTGGALDVNFNHVNMGLAGLPITGIPAVGSCATFDVTSTEDEGYWIGTPQSSALGDGAYTLALTGENFSTVTDLCQLTLLKRVGTGNWTTPGTHLQPTGSIGTPTVSRSGISGFSNFGFGGGAPNPLPVELTSFTGTCLEDGISRISWTTASEFNSKQFVVQRSEDGIHYTPVAVVPAAGFSNQARNYSITDTSVNANSSYYRLIEVDNNNQQTIYSFIQVKCNEVDGVHIYYTQPKVVVEVNSTRDKQVSFNVYEVSGKLIHQENRQVVRGYNRFDLSIKNKLADGIYIIQMQDGDKATSTKVNVH